MTAKELYELIDSLSTDIEFSYNGKEGAICPLNRCNISVVYNGVDKDYDSIEAVMNDTFYNGKSLNEISEQIEIY